LDTPLVGKHHSIQSNHIATAAITWADEPWQQLDNGDRGESLIAITWCAGDIDSIEVGTGRFGKRVRLRPGWRPRARQRHVLDGGYRSPGRTLS
ncbi:MAG: hypothetical protein WAL49_01895, partial [Pseudolabrys sp.]